MKLPPALHNLYHNLWIIPSRFDDVIPKELSAEYMSCLVLQVYEVILG